MKRPAYAQTVLIGVGNTFRRDDGVGVQIARMLKQELAERLPVSVVESSGEGASLMQAWQGYHRVYLFDAVRSNDAPGCIHRLQAAVQNFPSDFFKYSSHAFSLAEAVELARVMDKLPEELIVYGVEGADFGYGEALTPDVERAAGKVVEQVLDELGIEEA